MDSRVSQGGASGGRSARHRSSLRPFCRPTPRRGPKRGLFCRPTPRRGQKGGLFCRPTPRRAPKGGLFCRPTPRRGQKGGLFCRPTPRGAAVWALHFGLTIKRSRIHHGNPIVYPANFAGVRRRPGKFRWRPKTPRQILLWWPQTPRTDSLASEDAPANFAVVATEAFGRALGLSSEVRSGLREQVVLERLEGARHRHTAFLALHKGTEPLGDLDRVTCGRLHRVEELGRVSRLEENARLARL